MVEQARFCICLYPSINGGASKISLACSFSVSYHIESQRMFQNQVEKEKVERERERKRERGESDLESSRKRKRRELEWVYVCGGEKTREKKKRMDEIERKNNIKNKK